MDVTQFSDLQLIEEQIQRFIRRYPLDQVLVGLKHAPSNVESFIIGGASLFAIRYCSIGDRTRKIQILSWQVLAPFVDLVFRYLTADPLGFDQDIQQENFSTNPIFTFLRIVGNQMPYNVSFFGQYAQPLLLFDEIPRRIAKCADTLQFNMSDSFQKVIGVPLIDFINVGFTAFAAAKNCEAFTGGYFTKARYQGLHLPNDQDTKLVLEKLVGDPQQLRELYQKYKLSDRKFAAYDFNPLFLRPIVRPWSLKKSFRMNQDRMIVPIPNLIIFKISTGIFYEMFNRYNTKFSEYFGIVFEVYVGEILTKSGFTDNLLSESDIRETYPTNQGKAPDWIVLDGSTAILIECKATRFSRPALTTGSEEAIRDSLKQTLKGLEQLYRFRAACMDRTQGLEKLHRCTNFKPILISFEPLYLINSPLFRKYINEELTNQGMNNFSWQILSVDELEKLQPYIAYGADFVNLLNEIESKGTTKVLNEIYTQTGLTFKDSFLYEIERELYQRLGLPDQEA